MNELIRIILISSIILLLGCWLSSSNYYIPPEIENKTSSYTRDELSWVELNYKERIDHYARIDKSIYCGEIACNVEPLKDVDANTFEVVPHSNYAKDKKNVYYPLEEPCIDYIDCGVCFCSKYIIKGASPNSFKYLGKDYAVDNQIVFFRGEQLRGADGNSFKVIDGPEFFYFAKDNNHVYKHNQIIKELDPLTFSYDKDDKRQKQ